MRPDRLEAGTASRLGSHLQPDGVNFALFSAHAEQIELCLTDQSGHVSERFILPERSGDIWHGFLPGAEAGQRYHYRAMGPQAQGLHFDQNLPLLDPYARLWTCGLAGGARPDCVVASPDLHAPAARPNTPWTQTIIYEGHAKGLTRQHPKIAPGKAGTYAALADPIILEHLVKLGITAVELLPVQAFADEPFLARKGLSNYWGYNPIGYFVAEPRYAASADALGEFRQAVDALHEAGIEVLLDVVYNHTGEGDLEGRTLSFRGIDNASYYHLDDQGEYLNDTGCGNMLNMGHPAVIALTMDSLRYWVETGGVDGFRFDLATTLGRDGREFSNGAALLDCLRQDPVLANVKLIAEPWDIGPGGYQLGAFGHPFGEWNDKFRDTVRRFWCMGDPVLPELAMTMLGSAPVFDHGGRRSWSSLNFLTSHDGFTLRDLVSFDTKHNEANLEDNRDGHGHNFSANHGFEGECDNDAVNNVRLHTQKNLLATLFLSQGTPMLLAGDEFGNSQLGNNNAYCQDNSIGWLDWGGDEHPLCGFVAELVKLRLAHPLLRQDRFLHGETLGEGPKRNVVWRRPDGSEMQPGDWQDEKCMSIRLDLSDGQENLAILINGNHCAELFHVEFGEVLLQTGRVQLLAESIILAPHSLAAVTR